MQLNDGLIDSYEMLIDGRVRGECGLVVVYLISRNLDNLACIRSI